MAYSSGSHIAVEARKYRENSLQKAPVNGTGELGYSYRMTGATGRLSRGTGSLWTLLSTQLGLAMDL